MKVAFTHNLKRSASEAEAEFDTPGTVEALCRAVEAAGHVVIPVEVSGSVDEWLPRLLAGRPDVVLNTAEGTHGPDRTAFFPALFDSLKLPYTGSNARVMTLTQDKHRTKECVAAAGVDVPRGILVTTPGSVSAFPACPVIVKPNFEGSSKGITESSVVSEAAHVAAVVARVMGDYPAGVLIEEYVPGTDVAVGFLEGMDPDILTPCTYVIAPAWENRFRLYDFRLKNTAPDEAVQVACPARIPPHLLEVVRANARKVVRALGLRGVARLDFRVRDDGTVFFIEANATPSLEPGASLFVALEAVGLDFSAAIGHLLAHASRSLPHDHSSP